MTAPSDSSYVRVVDQELLRRALAARTAGNQVAAQRWWDELVELNVDRVRNFVRAQAWDWLSADERDEATQIALIRLRSNLLCTFRGTTMGAWVQATRRLVEFACRDVQRAAARRSAREVSLDAAASPGEEGDAGHWDRELYAVLEQQRAEQESREGDEEELREGASFLDWALPRLPAGRRRVIELDREEMSMAEMQAKLGMSAAAIYAARSRALKDLSRLRGEWAA